MRQLKIATLSSIGLVMVLAFQNCGQQGAVGIEAAEIPTASKSTDTMIISPNEPNKSSEAQCDDDNSKESFHDKNDSELSCKDIQIADILLKIDSISVGSEGPGSGMIELEELDAAISMNKLHVTIRATKDIARVKSLFMVLKAVGNKVLDMNNTSHDLKTPSGQTAGVKVQLASEVSLKAGEIYSLQFSIDPAQQIVSNPMKCLFKPVLRGAKIVVALVDTLQM